MFALKSAMYVATIAAAFFFAFWELKIRRRLTDGALPSRESPSGLGVLNDVSKQITRERVLRNLPRERLSKYRTVVALKFVFVALLIVEVLVLQR
jgi:hypothetical protein